MRKLLVLAITMTVLFTACAQDPVNTTSGAETNPTATSIPTQSLIQNATPTPTPLVIPTTAATVAPATPTSTAVPTATATPPATATPATANAVPATATATAVPPTATAVPAQPTSTSVPPTATPYYVTPTPTSTWINPDCYPGTGAADEPVWWCGGKICVVGNLHYGCPTTPPPVVQNVQIGCSISDRNVVVNETLTMRALQKPAGIPVIFAFNHGDGTIDHTAQSTAYYEAPGTYAVTLLWQHAGGKGTTSCGSVHVRPATAPTPTPTATPHPTVQIGCKITPSRVVQVNETLRFTAFQQPASVPVAYVFDHGDGTLDETSSSLAYYAAPGFYDVVLRWAHSGASGTTFCGTVTVTPQFSAGNYIGRSPEAAKAVAANKGFVVRVNRIDDQVFPGTDDYRTDRVNFEIDNNVVTKATLG